MELILDNFDYLSIHSLDDLKGLQLISRDMYHRPSTNNIKKIIDAIGDIPPLVNEIHNFTSGFSFEWYYKEDTDGEYFTGKTHVNTLFFQHVDHFTGRKVKKGNRLFGYLWDDSDSPDWVEKCEDKFYLLDIVDFISNTYVVVDIDANSEKNLCLITYPNFVFPLTLNIYDYFLFNLKYRGIVSWQDSFIDFEILSDRAETYFAQKRQYNYRSIAKKLFPNENFDEGSSLKSPDNIYEFNPNNGYCSSLLKKSNQLKSILKLNQDSFQLSFEWLSGPRPINMHVVNKIEYILGRPLPNYILDFYSTINGFRLKWELSKSVYADFNLLPLHNVFGGNNPHLHRHWNGSMHEGIVTMKNVMDDATLRFAEQCYLIYSSELEDVVLHFVEGKIDPELYVINAGKFIKLQLSFTEFVYTLLNNMGVCGWTYFHTSIFDFSDRELATFIDVPNVLKKLFPEGDFGKYRKVNQV